MPSFHLAKDGRTSQWLATDKVYVSQHRPGQHDSSQANCLPRRQGCSPIVERHPFAPDSGIDLTRGSGTKQFFVPHPCICPSTLHERPLRPFKVFTGESAAVQGSPSQWYWWLWRAATTGSWDTLSLELCRFVYVALVPSPEKDSLVHPALTSLRLDNASSFQSPSLATCSQPLQRFAVTV